MAAAEVEFLRRANQQLAAGARASTGTAGESDAGTTYRDQLISGEEAELRQLLHEQYHKVKAITADMRFSFAASTVDGEMLRRILTCAARREFYPAVHQLLRYTEEEIVKVQRVFQLFDERQKEDAMKIHQLEIEVEQLRHFRDDFIANRKGFFTKLGDKIHGEHELTAVERQSLQRSLMESERLAKEMTTERADLRLEVGTLQHINQRLLNRLRVAEQRLQEAGLHSVGQDTDIVIRSVDEDARGPLGRTLSFNRFAPPSFGGAGAVIPPSASPSPFSVPASIAQAAAAAAAPIATTPGKFAQRPGSLIVAQDTVPTAGLPQHPGLLGGPSSVTSSVPSSSSVSSAAASVSGSLPGLLPLMTAPPALSPAPAVFIPTPETLAAELDALSPGGKPMAYPEVEQIKKIAKNWDIICGKGAPPELPDFHAVFSVAAVAARQILNLFTSMQQQVDRDWRNFGRQANAILQCLIAIASSSPGQHFNLEQFASLLTAASQFATTFDVYLLAAANPTLILTDVPPDGADFRPALTVLLKTLASLKAVVPNFPLQQE